MLYIVVRTQLYLEQKDLEVLHLQARNTRLTISELVRRAIRERYAAPADRRREAMTAFVGSRKHRRDIPGTERYIRQLRRDTRFRRLDA